MVVIGGEGRGGAEDEFVPGSFGALRRVSNTIRSRRYLDH